MKTLRNSENLTFIQGVLLVFEKQLFTNVKNSWSEKFLKIHRKALQAGVTGTSAEVYEYLRANFMSLKASNSSDFIKKGLQHMFSCKLAKLS